MSPLLCIGLMSGTSMDGVDGVLAEVGAPARPGDRWRVAQRAFASVPMPPALAHELLALNTAGADELHRAALAANALMRLYADCVRQLCAVAGVAAADVAVVGAHGQTVRHRPGEFDGTGYTLQLVNGALLAERTGIPVACDFRSRDVAAGGQGAPLVPLFHQAIWGGDHGAPLAVLNLGGIANLSVLRPGQPAVGFDCGPANALLDHWVARHTGRPYDADGAWAAQGTSHADLLAHLLAEPFIDQPPPKSTGRDLFNPAWLEQRLRAVGALPPADVQATLAAFTVQAVARHLRRDAPDVATVVVCGGGVRNAELMRLLRAALAGVRVQSAQDWGVDPQAVEASAFAWLAYQTLHGLALDMRAVTGARGPRVLGCLYPA